MNKIIVRVYLPANSKNYDVRLPEDMRASDAADVLGDIFSEAARGFYSKSDMNILCFLESGEILSPDVTLREAGVVNRTRLMFI